MSSFVIEGGHRLHGTITPAGAKNEALQVICATLLTDKEVTISNVPDIADVNNLISLLADMGVKVTDCGNHCWSFRADAIDTSYFDTREYVRRSNALRGSIMLLGPILTRFHKAVVARPGGDKIGRRPIDTHLEGLRNLGAAFDYDAETASYLLTTDRLKGCDMVLAEASVTGTANVIMAAVLAKGRTTIYNAACEPYVQQLCRMLVRMGARIEGISSNYLTIDGVDSLQGCSHEILPDMIEVGSFIATAAMTQSALTIKNVSYSNLGVIPGSFRKMGVNLVQQGDDIYVPEQSEYEIDSYLDGSIMKIADAPWPGLTPDLLSVMLVLATQSKGSVLIHQKMFESRLFFVDNLIDMGAQIILCDPHRAVVVGHNHQRKLKGRVMTSPDIRAGIALLIAALGAEGESVIHNVEQIDRGYESIDLRLASLGAKIRREE